MRKFERKHDLELEWDGVASCGYEIFDTDVYVNSGLEYRTPSQFSRYGIVYELLVSATYSPDSEVLSLSIPDSELHETEDVLQFIDSLEAEIAEFESNLQVEEFSIHFENEGIDIRGTVHGDSLWIETDPSLRDSRGLLLVSAHIFYSMSAHSIHSYRLPNRITWEKFPEVTIAHRIINENLLTNELSDCVIWQENSADAVTGVSLRADGSAEIGVRLACGDAGENGSLELTLYPDGSYEHEYREAYRQPDE